MVRGCFSLWLCMIQCSNCEGREYARGRPGRLLGWRQWKGFSKSWCVRNLFGADGSVSGITYCVSRHISRIVSAK